MQQKEEEKSEEIQKDSIMGNSQDMKLSHIPLIARQDSQEKGSLSVVFSGECLEGIIETYLKIFLILN